MRQLVMTKGERFDIDSIRPELDAIVKSFDRYLDDYRPKTIKTMHGVMKPVQMILDGARVRKENAATLVGRAMREREMNPANKGYLPPEALAALETATAKLLELCNRVPVTAITKVTERIRYSVYYARRKKINARYEQTRKELIQYLRGKYPNDAALAQAWDEDGLTFESIRYPSKRETQLAKGKKKEDLEAFWSLPIAERLIEEEDENE